MDMIEIVAQAKVITAIENLGGVDGVWISIGDLRKITNMESEDFDAAMIALAHRFSIIAAPEDNQKTITAADTAAAVKIGGQWCHLVTVA